MYIVTGASRGIGKEICKRLIKNGYPVLGLARNVKLLKFDSISCDVTSYENIREVSKFIKTKKKKISGLINAAGVASMNLALTTPPNIVKKLIETNLIGTIYCSQNFTPFLIRNKKGSIINFSSIAVPLSLKGESIYVASKSGVEAFSKSFAKEVSSFNINVNCISPGPINTDLLKGVGNKKIKALISKQIINKQFKIIDIYNLVELLIDYRASSITGQIINVGGV